MIASLTVAAVIMAAAVHGMYKGVDIFGAMTDGALDGFRVLVRMAATLVCLMTAMSMLRASGALEIATEALRPVFELAGIPPECAPLVLMRPVSGSGALAIGIDIMKTYGVDTYIGRCAAVMLGSTETTFYVLGVYCGGIGVSRTRYALPVALCADAVGFVTAAHITRIFFGLRGG